MSAPRDRSWSDERIEAAYRSMVGQGSAPDAIPAAMAAIERGGPRPSNRLLRTWRPTHPLAGLATAILVVCVLGAALVYRAGMPAAASPTPAFSVEPPQAMNVSQAITAMAAGGLTDTDLLTVQGWLQPMPLLPVMSCPTFMPEYAFGIPPDLRCGATLLTLSEPQDGQGPSFKIVVLDGTSLPEQLANHPSTALQAVVVGHVHDRRASLCSAEVRSECEAAFVLDQIASLDGTALGPSFAVVRGESNPTPRMSEAQVLTALDPVLFPGSYVVSVTAVTLYDAVSAYMPAFGPSGGGDAILWYVRVTGQPPTTPPMPGAHLGSGVLVVDDLTGAFRGGGGWGWDPAKIGIVMPDGTISLRTTNWLPGGTCAGVGLDAVLRGSRDDPRVVWLEYNFAAWYSPDPAAPEPTILWPAGYRARFTPEIEILDATGTVVLRDGDHVDGACGNDPDTNTEYLEPPFR